MNVGRERERLLRIYENMCGEIKTYENNLGFLNASSKSGNSLVAEMQRKMEKLKADAQRRTDAAEVSKATGVPAALLLHCADRADMEAFAEEYAGIEKPPAAPPAPQSRIVRGGGSKPSTADQFAEMAEHFFRH